MDFRFRGNDKDRNMMKMNNKGFMGMVGLILTVAIICFMAYFVYKKYMLKPTGMDQNTQSMAQEAGFDTSSQTGILSSAKSIIKDAENTENSRN